MYNGRQNLVCALLHTSVNLDIYGLGIKSRNAMKCFKSSAKKFRNTNRRGTRPKNIKHMPGHRAFIESEPIIHFLIKQFHWPEPSISYILK